ncbi:MAG: V-type ATP synthase subunit I [Thermoplasmata archaeon]|jgi:V/A-type H+-transporting ATPase subunit I
MLLRPAHMEKVGFIALRDDEERVLTALHDLRVAQVEPLSPRTMSELVPEHASEIAQRAASQNLRIRGLLSALPAVGTAPPRHFEALVDVLAAAEQLTIDDEVGALKREDDQLVTQEKDVRDTLTLLDNLSFYDEPLKYLWSENFLAFYGEASPGPLAVFQEAMPQVADAQVIIGASDPLLIKFLVVLRPAGADALSRAGQSLGVRLTAVPRLSGRPSEERVRLAQRAEEIAARRGQVAARLRAIAAEWYPTVQAIAEALEIENRKSEVIGKLGAGRSTFALEAWVPSRDVARLEAALQEATRGRVYFYKPATKDEPPTLMTNPRGVRRFEFFIRFYSLPQSTEYDPTLIFAIMFPVLFGIMLGDWGYGITILVICLWMIRGFPGAQHLPKFGRHFIKLIMSPRGLQQLAWTLLPGCGLAIALGLVFDEFFGFHMLHLLIGTAPLADPLHQVGFLLKVAGLIGLGMVTLGFALGALNQYYRHHYRGVITKVGGIAFAWGISWFGLQILTYRSLPPPFDLVTDLSIAGLAIGVVMLIVGEGMFGALGLIDIVSHILSFTRLAGILLASVVLAIVVNTIAVDAWHGVGIIVGPILAALVIIVGQAFNVILGVFEPGIQAARLIFVEHFSSYYTGNGRPFRPFGGARTYTVSSVRSDRAMPAGPPR